MTIPEMHDALEAAHVRWSMHRRSGDEISAKQAWDDAENLGLLLSAPRKPNVSKRCVARPRPIGTCSKAAPTTASCVMASNGEGWPMVVQYPLSRRQSSTGRNGTIPAISMIHRYRVSRHG